MPDGHGRRFVESFSCFHLRESAGLAGGEDLLEPIVANWCRVQGTIPLQPVW